MFKKFCFKLLKIVTYGCSNENMAIAMFQLIINVA